MYIVEQLDLLWIYWNTGIYCIPLCFGACRVVHYSVFICTHKAYQRRLPSTLSRCIAQKGDLSNSIRAHGFYWCHVLTHVLWRTLYYIAALCFGTRWLPNILTVRIPHIVTLPKWWKLFKAIKFNVKPWSLVLNLDIFNFFESKWIVSMLHLLIH